MFFRGTATFEGEVKYKKLIVEEGAAITGTLMNLSANNKPTQQATQNGQATTTN